MFADVTAKEAARKPVGPLHILPVLPERLLPPSPVYSEGELELGRTLGATTDPGGWKILPSGRTLVPQHLGRRLIEQIHQSTHLGSTKVAELLQRDYYIPNLHQMTQQITAGCLTCAQVNPGKRLNPLPGVRLRGQAPGEQWETDFTEIKPGKYGYRYLLVFVDTFSGWVEAFPTKSETAQVVVKKLVMEIVPRFGLPLALGSDNGPAFIAKTTQLLAQVLQIKWKLHCIYRPQSSGQVERMNRTLKEILCKLRAETGEDWVSLLPFALLRTRCTPYVRGITPYEIMFGRPPPLVPKVGEEKLAELSDHALLKSLQALQLSTRKIHNLVRAAHSSLANSPSDKVSLQVQPGDLVWIKKLQPATLEPRWTGPLPVILTTPTAVKVAGKRHWIHHTQIKKATPVQEERWTARPTEDPLKIRLLRHSSGTS
ncbi:protein NYNRIN-like [Lemur catta]|uniref:protein NYNRIN-like n=1 Tax=Lemur catta TaxID=9447 RepID=UPI001E269A47|nr:protein NYNRIN-like [Lemur catta]